MLMFFGFQVEECFYWEVLDVYYVMLFFMYVDKVNELIFFIYGVLDNNFGIFFLQSECYFVVLKGYGVIVRFVMFLLESYGYCLCELFLYMFWEQEQWFECYVKLLQVMSSEFGDC